MRTKTGGVARAHRAPSLLEIAKAHWANYRCHLRVPEEYSYAEDAERALDWQAYTRPRDERTSVRRLADG